MKKSQLLLNAFTVWILTAVSGSTFHAITKTIGLEFVWILVLSLLGSIPAALFLIPNVIVLDSLIGKLTKSIYAFASVAILRAIVIIAFVLITKGYPFDPGMRTRLLAPYIISAEFCFFLVCRRMILSK
jgi:hypothetical protein